MAFSSTATIGVDIEQIAGAASFAGTIADCLTAAERAYLSARSVFDTNLLLQTWARKVAVAKVFGSGIAALRDLTVLDREGSRFYCRLPGNDAIVNGIDLQLHRAYVSALASTDAVGKVKTYHIACGDHQRNSR